jgi:Amino acid permease
MVGLGAAETADPRKSLPRAIKQVFWRVSAVSISTQSPLSLLTSSPVLSHLPPPHRSSGPIHRPPPAQWRYLRRRKSLTLRFGDDKCRHQGPPLSLQRRNYDCRTLGRQFLNLRFLTYPRRSRRAASSPQNPRLVRQPPLPLHKPVTTQFSTDSRTTASTAKAVP